MLGMVEYLWCCRICRFEQNDSQAMSSSIAVFWFPTSLAWWSLLTGQGVWLCSIHIVLSNLAMLWGERLLSAKYKQDTDVVRRENACFLHSVPVKRLADFSLWGKRVWTCWTCCDQRAVCWEHFSSCGIEFVSSYTCWLIVCSFVLGSVYFVFHFMVGHDGDLLVGKPILPPFEQIVCMFLRWQIILLQTDSSRP